MNREHGHFEIHIIDAMRINLGRRRHYVALAGWRAWLLSVLLVASERLCRPLARHFDRKARPFNEAGIGIVADDFIDMALIEPVEKAPRYRGRAPRSAHADVKRQVKHLKRDGLKALASGDYSSICSLVARALENIAALEAQHQAHFAMSVHLLESLGFAALHAPDYIAADASCEPLARQLVAIQLRLCDGGLLMDRLAQHCHQHGAGILVNDVPHIPFLRDWDAAR